MEQLVNKANEAMLEAQWLRREGRSLRMMAAMHASELGEKILKLRAQSKPIAENRKAQANNSGPLMA